MSFFRYCIIPILAHSFHPLSYLVLPSTPQPLFFVYFFAFVHYTPFAVSPFFRLYQYSSSLFHPLHLFILFTFCTPSVMLVRLFPSPILSYRHVPCLYFSPYHTHFVISCQSSPFMGEPFLPLALHFLFLQKTVFLLDLVHYLKHVSSFQHYTSFCYSFLHIIFLLLFVLP